MPGRTTVLATGEIYHVTNRGVASQPIFLNSKNYQRAQSTIFYYQNKNLPLKYSKFITLAIEERNKILTSLRKKSKFLVEIIAYCLMPNHLHLLLKQTEEGSISKFMSNFANSFTRYFNTKFKRIGPLFQGKFYSVRIETNEQLLHVSRYIHLNPHTAYITKTLEDLENYPYSSLGEYLNKSTPTRSFCAKEILLEQFPNPSAYKQFVFDQAGYQRTLENIKHLLLEI